VYDQSSEVSKTSEVSNSKREIAGEEQAKDIEKGVRLLRLLTAAQSL
jgi:hypothetical protein